MGKTTARLHTKLGYEGLAGYRGSKRHRVRLGVEATSWKLCKIAKFALHLLVGARRRSYIHRGRTPTASSYNEISGSMDGTSHERMDAAAGVKIS